MNNIQGSCDKKMILKEFDKQGLILRPDSFFSIEKYLISQNCDSDTQKTLIQNLLKIIQAILLNNQNASNIIDVSIIEESLQIFSNTIKKNNYSVEIENNRIEEEIGIQEAEINIKKMMKNIYENSLIALKMPNEIPFLEFDI